MANTSSPPHTPDAGPDVPPTLAPPAATRGRRADLRSRLAGGTDGNERLTVLSGLLLVILFTGMGVTILRMGQLLWFHLFLGLTLGGPILLKLSSAGYRFVQYYRGDHTYRRRGVPATALRVLAPLLILCTLGLLATGLTLLLIGPSARQPVLLFHKLFFFSWLAIVGLHILLHLPDIARVRSHARQARRTIPRLPTTARRTRQGTLPGARARTTALLVSVLLGLTLATALTARFHIWAHRGPVAGPVQPFVAKAAVRPRP
jgi:hypothetical protein